MKAPLLSAAEIEELLAREFPQAFYRGCGIQIERVTFGAALLRQTYSPAMLRPGGTISGPTMMALADYALYVAVFSAAGRVPLAVTTSLNINFLRKPESVDLLASATLLKQGKRLVVGEATLRSDGADDAVAHVTATYSIPPTRK